MGIYFCSTIVNYWLYFQQYSQFIFQLEEERKAEKCLHFNFNARILELWKIFPHKWAKQTEHSFGFKRGKSQESESEIAHPASFAVSKSMKM